MGLRCFVSVILAVLLAAPAAAKEIEVIGRGVAAVGPDAAGVKIAATRAAKRTAVVNAIEKVLGPNATKDPRVAGKVDAVVAQVADDRIIDSKSARVGTEYEVTVTIVLDDKSFRALLSDLGIAVNTATVRGFSILAVMDEFLTTPRDVRAPLEELVEYRREVGHTFEDSSHSSESSASAGSVRVKADSSISATRAGASIQGGSNFRGAAESSASSASSSVTAVASEAHDNEAYRKLVKYQPQGGRPEKTSQAYNALMGELQEYDLRVLDNDQFKSKYFKDQPLTIEEMQNGEHLSRYVKFAKTEANADFFMVGTSIIIDGGKNANTGDAQCTGVVTVKTYSTVDGESIASETISESAAGLDLNDCAGALAKKMARIGGPVVGARVQDYWKRRSAYGREFVLTLKGASLNLMTRAAFTKAVKSVPGVENDTQRASSATQLQLAVTYKGQDPIDQAVATVLADNPTFATLDSRTDGNQVVLCLGPCDDVEKRAGEAR